jgi:formiminotetrahydrofolate cyclodeaminase
MYRDQPLRKYLDDAAAAIPAPGGGSVSALAGALAAAMGCMAANFTVGKEKFKSVEPEAKRLITELESARAELLNLTEDDVEVYGPVLEAGRMPNGTKEEKAARREAMQRALVAAMQIPLRTIRVCTATLGALKRLVEIGNPNLIGDVAVSAILGEAALRGAAAIVETNLKWLKDETLVRNTQAVIGAARSSAAAALDEVLTQVKSVTER